MRHLHRDLDLLKRRILGMGTMVESLTNIAIAAFEERRADLAEEAMALPIQPQETFGFSTHAYALWLQSSAHGEMGRLDEDRRGRPREGLNGQLYA